MSDNLEAEVMRVVERVVLKKIGEGNWLTIPMGNRGVEVNREFLRGLFARIDMARISDLVVARIEERIADKIFNQLATGVANDTKSLMCDNKARELFRDAIRERISAVCVDEVRQ